MNSKIQYRIHAYLTLVPVWSQKNQVNTFKPHFLSLFLPFMPRSQVVSLTQVCLDYSKKIHVQVAKKFCF